MKLHLVIIALVLIAATSAGIYFALQPDPFLGLFVDTIPDQPGINNPNHQVRGQ